MTAVVVHPASNSNVKHLLVGLERRGLLQSFQTGFDTTLIHRLLGANFGGLAQRRAFPSTIHKRTSAHTSWALKTRALSRVGLATGHQVFKSFGLTVSSTVSGSSAGVIIAYEDGARDLFLLPGGRARVYDLPMPHWRLKHRLLRDEANNNPDWAPTLGGLEDPHWVLDAKDEELRLADVVLTASRLTSESVREARPHSVIEEIPYGCNKPNDAGFNPTLRSPREPLRVLFVGELTQRKGISYVFDARRELGRSVTLTVVGRKPRTSLDLLNAELGRCNYIPSLSSSQVHSLMASSDVLVLPSIVEGFGLVISEALSAGIPVLTTDRTGGYSLFGLERPDWIVRAGSAHDLITALADFARDGQLLRDAKAAAAGIAARHSWTSYENRVADVTERLS